MNNVHKSEDSGNSTLSTATSAMNGEITGECYLDLTFH